MSNRNKFEFFIENMNNEEVCYHFLEGKCHFGRSCRFSHPTISNGDLANSCGNLTNSNGRATNKVERSVSAGECSTSANQYLTSFDDHSIDTNAQSSYAHHHSSRYVFVPGNSNNTAQLAMTPKFISSYQLFAESDYNNRASKVVINNSNKINSVKQLKTYAEVVAENTENGEIVKNADQAQRKQHTKKCVQKHQRDMDLSLKVAQCSEKICMMCSRMIMEEPRRERKFGILPNCTHVFCLDCICKWRHPKHFRAKVVRSCPVCSIKSDFVCSSDYWVESKEDKDKLIADYKSALGKKHCKYFKKGEGDCPFGNRCFHKHELPNGELLDVGLSEFREQKCHTTEKDVKKIFDGFLNECLNNPFRESELIAYTSL